MRNGVVLIGKKKIKYPRISPRILWVQKWVMQPIPRLEVCNRRGLRCPSRRVAVCPWRTWPSSTARVWRPWWSCRRAFVRGRRSRPRGVRRWLDVPVWSPGWGFRMATFWTMPVRRAESCRWQRPSSAEPDGLPVYRRPWWPWRSGTGCLQVPLLQGTRWHLLRGRWFRCWTDRDLWGLRGSSWSKLLTGLLMGCWNLLS